MFGLFPLDRIAGQIKGRVDLFVVIFRFCAVQDGYGISFLGLHGGQYCFMVFHHCAEGVPGYIDLIFFQSVQDGVHNMIGQDSDEEMGLCPGLDLMVNRAEIQF